MELCERLVAQHLPRRVVRKMRPAKFGDEHRLVGLEGFVSLLLAGLSLGCHRFGLPGARETPSRLRIMRTWLSLTPNWEATCREFAPLR